MAEPLDVAARLAEGHPSVGNIGDYVWACHLLGYQNPDFTLHAAQVRDWYSSEDGLDLKALDADRAALDAAAAATQSARQLQEEQLGALAEAWQGRGGDASHDFLRRHGEASAAATSAVRDAVDQLTTLRDDLWRVVDEKVAAAVADRRPPHGRTARMVGGDADGHDGSRRSRGGERADRSSRSNRSWTTTFGRTG